MTLKASHDRPWMMPQVIDWFESVIKPDWTILETGAGGSTVFFAQRAASVMTFEHDQQWAADVAYQLAVRNLPNVIWRVYSYPAFGLMPLLHTSLIDLACIDGRGRVQSVLDAIPLIKPGGLLLLDDSDRERYKEAREAADAAMTTRFVFSDGENHTTVWRKPEDAK